jgi:anti-anti-sigma factor
MPGGEARSGAARTGGPALAASVALSIELSAGPPGARARIEIHERGSGRVALLALHGGIDGPAVSRLGRALSDLALQGVDQVLLDCSGLEHVDYRIVPALVDRLVQFEARVGGLVVCGLSHYLRDLFRLAGCDAQLRCWPSASELLPLPATLEPGRECAS